MTVMIVMALAILLLRLMHKLVMPLIDRYFFRFQVDPHHLEMLANAQALQRGHLSGELEEERVAAA
ncbi:MAG: hypothetical protein H0V18_04325 [Pyrinomonadaceae bacterium]|nr:hypothetical protein [Pyrinomonadaceae bacterium]